MFQNAKTKAAGLLTLAGASLVASPAFAQSAGTVDVSGVTEAIGSAAGPIASIGGAVLLVLVGIKVYKWVRRAM